LGLGFCSGDVIIITDIDTSFDRDAFENAIKPLSDEKVGAVAGNLGVRNPFESVVCAYQTIQYLISISLGRRVTHMLGILSIVSGAFGVFRKDLLLACGGWEVGPGEDADLTLKIRNAGYKIAFAPNAWALTDVPNSLFALIRQRLRWNRSLVRIRLRKFKTLLNPYNKNFSILNAISTIDAFSFQFFLAVSFYAYIIWLFIYYGEFGLIILFLISSVYVLTGLLSFSIASIASKRRASLALIPYALTYGLFNSFVLRAVRVYAYLDELLYRKSYKDSYVPQKVLDNTEKF
jgi:cellulose synthase/poly-beta-1,6-N-acetylglucosamine synthase-like glycosyltransferase